MSKPAARLGDGHLCPLVTPGAPPIPHVGGPIITAGGLDVFIEGKPVSCIGDLVTCVGPPDTIVSGAYTVLARGKPIARAGDQTAHGGVISTGSATVLIGEALSQSALINATLLAPNSKTGKCVVVISENRSTWIAIKLLDSAGNGVPGELFRAVLPEGAIIEGNLDVQGRVRLEGVEAGNCRISFPNIPDESWEHG